MPMYMCDSYYQTCLFTAVTLSLSVQILSTLMLCIEKLHCYAILCLVMYACRVIFKWEILYCLVNVVATKLNMT